MAAGKRVPSSSYFRLEQLAPGVFAAVANPGSGAMANAGIVDLGETTVVFDTFATLGAAADLRRSAEALTGRPVTYVVNSHEHLDHVHGNAVFAGAAIISTAATREWMAARRPAFIKTAREHPEYPDVLAQQAAQEPDAMKRRELLALAADFRALAKDLPHLEVHLPTVTFAGRMTLHGSARTVELYALGGGHSPSDTFLYLPAERIAFMGDLLYINVHPALRFGNPAEWIRILDQVAGFSLEVAVPGHGPVGNRSHLLVLRDYIQWLQDHAVEMAERDGEPVEAAVPEAYAGWESPGVMLESLQFLMEQRKRAPSSTSQTDRSGEREKPGLA